MRFCRFCFAPPFSTFGEGSPQLSALGRAILHSRRSSCQSIAYSSSSKKTPSISPTPSQVVVL